MDNVTLYSKGLEVRFKLHLIEGLSEVECSMEGECCHYSYHLFINGSGLLMTCDGDDKSIEQFLDSHYNLWKEFCNG